MKAKVKLKLVWRLCLRSYVYNMTYICCLARMSKLHASIGKCLAQITYKHIFNLFSNIIISNAAFARQGFCDRRSGLRSREFEELIGPNGFCEFL